MLELEYVLPAKQGAAKLKLRIEGVLHKERGHNYEIVFEVHEDTHKDNPYLLLCILLNVICVQLLPSSFRWISLRISSLFGLKELGTCKKCMSEFVG